MSDDPVLRMVDAREHIVNGTPLAAAVDRFLDAMFDLELARLAIFDLTEDPNRANGSDHGPQAGE